MFTKKRILVVALSAALAACGGGDKASQSEFDALSVQVAAQQKTIDGLNASSAQQIKDLQDRLTAQQATLDDLLAKMAANTETLQSQWQEILTLRATIEEQQKYIKQLQAGSEKLDMAGPVLKNFTVSMTDVLMPGTLVLSVEAADTGSGMLKVEFYEAGKDVPVAVDARAPYSAILPLGAQDNGTHSYYVRAYDMAVNAAGTVSSNISSNADAAVPVKVAIPDNGMEAVGSLKADFGVENLWLTNLKPDPHHDGVFVALTSEWSGSNLLKVDYGKKTAGKLASASNPSLDIAFHPKQADTLFRTVDYEIQSSTDGGVTWSTVATRYGYYPGTPGYASYGARYLAFTPNGNSLFAYSYGNGYYGGSSFGDSLSFSVDGGVNWNASIYPASYSGESVGWVMVGGGNEQVVYASTATRVLRSSDGGRNFAATGDLPASLSYYPLSLSADPFDANAVLALVQVLSPPAGQQSKLYRSTDGGASWSAVQMPATPLGQALFGGQSGTVLMSVVHSPYVKGLVYMPAFVGQNSAMVLRSKDGGASWELLPFFDPATKGDEYRASVNWLVTTKPDADGAVQLFLPSSNGFDRYLDRTALK